MMEYMICSSVKSINEQVLLDTGAPRKLCSEEWLHKSNWHPIKNISLSPGTRTLIFAGHPVHPLYAALFVDQVRDLSGKVYHLKLCEKILPPTPIPFLYGLVYQREMSFDICLRNGNYSYLTKNNKTFETTFPFTVSSHIWMIFKPVNRFSLKNPE